MVLSVIKISSVQTLTSKLHTNSCREIQMWRHLYWKHPDCFQVRTAKHDGGEHYWVEPHGRQQRRNRSEECARHCPSPRVLSFWEQQQQRDPTGVCWLWAKYQQWQHWYHLTCTGPTHNPHSQHRGLSTRRMSMAGRIAFLSHFNKLIPENLPTESGPVFAIMHEMWTPGSP